MADADCPPLDVRITKSLLGYGVIAGPIYLIVAAAQMVTRDGYDPTRHAVSQLVNGPCGWVQVANFVVVGAMTIAGAVGIGRALPPSRPATWSAALLAGYGIGLVAAGIFRADPSDGFPPGTPPGVGTPSWHGVAHFLVAGVGFACFAAAGLTVGAVFARSGANGWAWFSRVVSVAFAAGFGALATGTLGAPAVLGFTAAVVLAWAWLTALSAKLYKEVGMAQSSVSSTPRASSTSASVVAHEHTNRTTGSPRSG
ncbi:DUF998 domain-containing protein [Mycobacterium sp. pW049]|uniref:DUF998 domain-containing protein n=1 Tax=[Mycobacterium] bulgaricum TaxID=3238985 RepID=UPI00351ACB8C